VREPAPPLTPSAVEAARNPMQILTSLVLGALAGLSLQTTTSALQSGECSASKKAAHAEKDIVETALAAGTFQTLAAALEAAGLVEALKGDGPYTVFAPSDAAFAKLPKGTLEMLLKPENRQRLVELLKYHVVGGRVLAADVVKLRGVESRLGQRLAIHVEDGSVRVAGARVVGTDLLCSNGVIHVVDAVLMPAELDLVALAKAAGTFRTLLAAAQAAGLADTLAAGGPFTLLAPTDEAFAKLPAGALERLLKPESKNELAALLKAHVIEGRAFADQVATRKKVHALSGAELAIHADADGLRIAGARVLQADLQAKNGVVHVIDTVLVPD